MTWRMEFYNERERRLVPYTIEAPVPAAAVAAGWDMLRAQHPARRARGTLGLLERAERASAHDRNGWVLYRIAAETGPGSPRSDATVTPPA
jgi:hypothetical protein